jgi:hypothetical protein
MRVLLRLVSALALLCFCALPQLAFAQDAAPIVRRDENETAATAIQRAVIEQHINLRGLTERYGADHPDARVARAALASVASSLYNELSARGRIDRTKIREWARVLLADADAQLAVLRVTYNAAHLDVRVALARRAAIDEALRAFERAGRFFSDVPVAS